MNLKSTTFFSSIYTALRMLAGMISVKVMAMVVGPTGVAYVGQFQSFLSIANNGANLGIGNGTIKYLAEYRDDAQRYQQILSSSFLLTLISSTVLSILILLFKDPLSLYLFKTTRYAFVFTWLGVSMVFYASAQVLSHALNAFQQIKRLIVARMVASLLGLGLTLILVISLGIDGALLALVVSQWVGFWVLVGAAYRSTWFSLGNFFKGIDRSSLRKLLQFSLMTFSSIILLNIRQIYLREYIIVELSPEAAGYWQAIWKISEMYLTVITTALAIYYLPKLSSIKEKSALRQEVFKGYRFLIPLVLLLSSLIFLFRDLIIFILFTPDFNPVRELFFYQLIGDVFKIASWILSFLLIAKAMTKTFIITEIIFIGLFMLLALFFVKQSGLIGMTYAFALTYIAYFFTMLFLFRKLLFLTPKNS